ncbi:MAG: TonB-dependent receptor plug domain-containing protein, partial [Gemmatimonadales bacterium]
ALSVVPGDELRRDATLGGPIERLQGLPGVDVAQRGLSQRTFAARGPSGLNSSALLVLSDFRPASLPSLRFNVPYLIPAIDEDLERIEVVRGPASALYGPDADRGVIHLVSSSPLDRQGTSLSLAGGGRSTFQGTLRHASLLGSRLGLKLSGQYARGDDWAFADPRDVVARDPLLERGAVNARLDWAATGNTRITVAGGLAQAIRLVDQTDIGPIQLRDWQSSYLQTRVESGRLFANLYLNANDAGGSFQLWSGVPVVDQSRALGAQIQYGGALGDRIDLRYGADLQRVVPRTGGTIHGANEDHDNITQAGVYAAATTRLTPRLDLVGAVRADHHSRLDDFV